MKIETSPILVLDNFVALRSKSYSFSYDAARGASQSNIQKSKQKGIQNAPKFNDCTHSLFNSVSTT